MSAALSPGGGNTHGTSLLQVYTLFSKDIDNGKTVSAMKFTTEPEPFLRIIQILAEPKARGRRFDPEVTLIASEGQLWVEQNGTAARTEAVVREDGQCTVDGTELLQAVKLNARRSRLCFEAGTAGLRVGDSVIPVSAYCSFTAPPGSCQMFLTTDIGVVHSKGLALASV